MSLIKVETTSCSSYRKSDRGGLFHAKLQQHETFNPDVLELLDQKDWKK